MWEEMREGGEGYEKMPLYTVRTAEGSLSKALSSSRCTLAISVGSYLDFIH